MLLQHAQPRLGLALGEHLGDADRRPDAEHGRAADEQHPRDLVCCHESLLTGSTRGGEHAGRLRIPRKSDAGERLASPRRLRPQAWSQPASLAEEVQRARQPAPGEAHVRQLPVHPEDALRAGTRDLADERAVLLAGEPRRVRMKREAGPPRGFPGSWRPRRSRNPCSVRSSTTTGMLSGKPCGPTQLRSRWSSRASACRAAGRQSGGDSSHAAGCLPGGAGSEGGASVPAGAAHSPGSWSSAFDSHHQMRMGVTSIQMRAKYQLSRRSRNFGCPWNASGILARVRRTYRSVLACRSASRTVASPCTSTPGGFVRPEPTWSA